MHQGSVDPKTGNVPLRLDGGYLVHFEGQRDDGTVLVRVARSITGPLLGFATAAELQRYVAAALPAHLHTVTSDEVAQWLEHRLAEPAA